MSIPKTLGAERRAKRRKAVPPYDPIKELRSELVKLILRVDHLEAAVERNDRFTIHQLKDLGDQLKDLGDRVGELHNV